MNNPSPSQQQKIPLSEVAFGLNFVAPDFSSVQFGEYYALIRDRYKSYRDVLPIVNQTLLQDQILIPRLPRVWFENGDRLIQLQSDRFIYNWRRLHNLEDAYPGYEKMSKEFNDEVSSFWEFLKTTLALPIHLEELNLTYVNHIQHSKSLKAPMFVFYDHKWQQDFAIPEHLSSQLRFDFHEENVRLTASARPAIQVGTNQTVTQFELIAQSMQKAKIGAPAETKQWYKTAHDLIQKAFKNLVGQEWIDKWEFANG